jgi:hypothetical protein
VQQKHTLSSSRINADGNHSTDTATVFSLRNISDWNINNGIHGYTLMFGCIPLSCQTADHIPSVYVSGNACRRFVQALGFASYLRKYGKSIRRMPLLYNFY